jgi:hypothetical protein
MPRTFTSVFSELDDFPAALRVRRVQADCAIVGTWGNGQDAPKAADRLCKNLLSSTT